MNNLIVKKIGIRKTVVMDNKAPQTPKPRRGAWHEQAREMRAAGLSYKEIGFRIGVTGTAVYFVINPHRRWTGKKETGAEAPVPSVSP